MFGWRNSPYSVLLNNEIHSNWLKKIHIPIIIYFFCLQSQKNASPTGNQTVYLPFFAETLNCGYVWSTVEGGRYKTFTTVRTAKTIFHPPLYVPLITGLYWYFHSDWAVQGEADSLHLQRNPPG